MTIRTATAIGLLLVGTSMAFAQTEPAPEAEAAPAEQAAAPASVNTATVALTISLDTAGDIDRKLVTYACDGGVALPVQYINAAPNFLAILPIDGENHIFATALSGSGARYVSGPYEWWSKGDEASLRDLMQDEDAAPLLSCAAAVNTP